MPDENSAITETFARLSEAGRRAFIPFITAGHPSPESTPDVLAMLAEEGADIVELGVPFTDPLADGPTIQRASWRALEAGVDVAAVLDWTREFAKRHQTPVVLFSYLNPILRFGPEAFARAALDAGASGLLITDLPVGADPEREAPLYSSGLDLVRLIAPTTTSERCAEIAAAAAGFIYYISRTGVTGERKAMRTELAGELEGLRALTDLPIAVGFGISGPKQAHEVAAIADGVVVGSALVRVLEEGGLAAARALTRELRSAIDA